MPRSPSLAEAVKAWREERELTIKELARRSRLSRGHLSEIESGRIRAPGEKTLQAIAQGLDISTQNLEDRVLPTDMLVFMRRPTSSRTILEALDTSLRALEEELERARGLLRQLETAIREED